MRRARGVVLLLLFLPASGWPAAGAEVEPLVQALLAVGPEGRGQQEAAAAWSALARADAAELPAVLAGLDGASPLAANWIRTAADAIAERTLRAGRPLPAAELETFVADRRHAPRARRLAYEWLLRADPTAAERLIPGMIDDPSLELRRDAVARAIAEAAALAEAGRKEEAATAYRRTLTSARDADQVRLLAGRLRALGQTVDLPRHFGYLIHWRVVGPFDNTDRKGFAAVYPPENGADLAAEYAGKHGPVRWLEYATGDDFGAVDLNKPLGEEKQVVGYAAAEFVSDGRREVELRLSTLNALKLWLNGRLVDQRDVYHSGTQMDQYVNRITLEPGRNRILLKVCQNEQTQPWAKVWGFQLRVCDPTGGAVLSSDRP